MHAIHTIKHWSHQSRDSAARAWRHVDQHLRSRHFWMGVAITLLVFAIVTLIVALARNAPSDSLNMYQYGNPYAPYR